MNNSQRLQQLLDRIKLQMFIPLSLQSLSIYFSTPDVIMHLKKLGITQLKNCLIWILPDWFMEIEYLGEGGFAKVYKGTANGYVFALKELKKNMLPELVLNVLLHSSKNGVVNVYGLTKHPQTAKYLMVMAYAHGGSLDDAPSKTYDWKTVTEYAYTLAICLHYIHSEGFVHSDLHPGNVVFLYNYPKLIDIGMSSSVEDMYLSNGVYGRLDYLPPEVFSSRLWERTPAFDVYCFATVLWQIVTGILPKGNAASAVKNNLDGLREELIPGAPGWFNELLRDCWNPRPERRPSMSEVKRRLSSQLSILQL
ncbi:kinase-like domain-containing protein [Endogone sp. FLAS-F59071]|nr:kinase-like domain-containing protein [Endogone sp. FLAS-F59071]|eukprot:RUS16085.1 kinase-like domain-containing protein [Endogone sp. FLAS-F59071]